MKIFQISKINNQEDIYQSEINLFLQKQNQDSQPIIESVQKIITQVRDNGDQAIIDLCNKFDQTNFSKISETLVKKEEIEQASINLDKDLKQALETSYQRIFNYHQKQMPKDLLYQDQVGVTLGNKWQAIESVAIYAPGGSASYPSSVLMSAIPAIVAGVKNLTLFSPSKNGKINPAILYAAQICKIDKIYKIGGAQAIATAAYGTKSIKKVDKIVGPGNAYVAMAKKIVYGDVGIDMIAGPTDLTIIADSKIAKANWVAADALSQLEHGPDSKAFIITNDTKFAQEIIEQIEILSKKLSRQQIIQSSLKNSAIFVIDDIEKAYLISNLIAPEHLQIISDNNDNLLKNIKNAGAIFLGNFTPEAIGDYIAGPSHTLPTEGTARFASGLSVFDFLKRMSIISCDQKSFIKVSSSATSIADCEGLDGHKLSLLIRNDKN